MPPISGNVRKRVEARTAASQTSSRARHLESAFVRPDPAFLELTKTLASTTVLARPIQGEVAVFRHDLDPAPPLALPRRPKWRYGMSKEELDANEQAYFRTWLAEQDAILRQKHAPTDGPMPHPPTQFERNIEVWRQFWRVTEISDILLVLLDSRCPPLHLPPSLSTYLHIPTPRADPSPRSKRSSNSKAPRVILVLTKTDISGSVRTASWTAFLEENYPTVPVVPVEAYTFRSGGQGPVRRQPHLPGSFRERLVRALQAIHEEQLQPPQWITALRTGESEQERLERVDRWKPRVKRVIDWDRVLEAKGKLVGKTVGGAAVPKGQGVEQESERAQVDDDHVSDENQVDDAYEWREPEFLTVGVIGQPNVGKSSLLNAIFGTTRVRASRTPGKTKHFQTLFWTADVRLVDCPGLVMPSFVPMDVQVLSGVLPISRISAVPFCVHQLSQLLPLERILELSHPLSEVAVSPAPVGNRDPASQSTKKAKVASKTTPSILVGDRRTWRPGQRPTERAKPQPSEPRWTANDIMTAYAEKKGWVTAKAGRPDVHRAGNAILRLVAEGRIPWAFSPPGSPTLGDDGIWLSDGVQRHGDGDDQKESDSEPEEQGMVRTDDEEEEEEEEYKYIPASFGRFGALQIDE